MRLITLMYHDVFVADADESGFRDTGSARYKLPVDDFDRHMEVLKKVLRDDPVLATDLEGKTINEEVALTFDDGGSSFYRIVAGRLEESGWRGHCFVTTSQIGNRGFLHANHLRQLHKRGHVIGSHSVSHPTRLAKCSRSQLINEWTNSKHRLEDILGAEVTTASVPGGYFSIEVGRCAAQAGIKALFTSEPVKLVREIDGCAVFGRFAVRRGHLPEYAGRLAAGEPLATAGQWTTWNVKKLLKMMLGANYKSLSRRIAASGLREIDH